jgi:hypothetical protein
MKGFETCFSFPWVPPFAKGKKECPAMKGFETSNTEPKNVGGVNR